MSTNQRKRLAVETPKEREARLQWMSINQHERLAVETPEERELRLEHYSTRYREQQSVQSQLPLLQQCSIQAKMRKFHVNKATLDHQCALLVQKNFLASISTQRLTNVCVVAATSTFRSYTPLPTT